MRLRWHSWLGTWLAYLSQAVPRYGVEQLSLILPFLGITSLMTRILRYLTVSSSSDPRIHPSRAALLLPRPSAA